MIGSAPIIYDSHAYATYLIRNLNLITHNYFINKLPDIFTEA